MRIGISTTDFKQTPSDELFGRITGLGFGVIQLGLAQLAESNFTKDGVFEIPDVIDGGLIRAARGAVRHGLHIAALSGTFNMSHPDADARREGVRRFDALGGAAGEIGCDLVTLCTGTRSRKHLWAPHPENGGEPAWSDMTDTLLRLVEIAERRNLRMAIETEASNVVDTPEKACLALDAAGSDRVGMIMDCANLFRPGEAKRADVDERIKSAFGLYGDRVMLAHGKDISESEGVSFCATGEGIVNYDLFLELLAEHKYAGDMVLHGIYDEGKMPCALEFMRVRMDALRS